MKLTHAIRQFAYKLIKSHLLLLNIISWRSLIIIIISGHGLARYIIDNILILLNKLVDLLSEVLPTQRTLCLYFKPLHTAFHMKVVLFVAGEDNNFVIRTEPN